MLQGKEDHYNGIIVETTSLPKDPTEFKEILIQSLQKWKSEKKKGIWIKIPIELSILIPIAIECGFIFHHAQSDYCMVVSWLSSSPNSLPLYATHYVGCGGFVLNEKNEVLVIKEKNGRMKGIWKIPGGMCNPGEDISEAAIREVFEETGIKTEFLSLLCFRQHNEFSFGLSDLYFVCRLKPLTFEIEKQEEEISECKWMPENEFFALPYYQGVYKTINDIEKKSMEGTYKGISMKELPISFMKGTNQLYSNL